MTFNSNRKVPREDRYLPRKINAVKRGTVAYQFMSVLDMLLLSTAKCELVVTRSAYLLQLKWSPRSVRLCESKIAKQRSRNATLARAKATWRAFAQQPSAAYQYN